jgi:hypothetical protein
MKILTLAHRKSRQEQDQASSWGDAGAWIVAVPRYFADCAFDNEKRTWVEEVYRSRGAGTRQHIADPYIRP